MSFGEIGISKVLAEGLKKQNITEPTDIQKLIIPAIMNNQDLAGQSETGSGKTLAYLLPLFMNLTPGNGMQLLILAPTHELASQIRDQADLLAKNSGVPFSTALLLGEVNITRQIDRLKKKPDLLIGSTGRIFELLEKKKINVETIKTLVIDEADRMLDQKSLPNLKKLLTKLRKDTQLLFFSASISPKTLETVNSFGKKVEFIRSEAENIVPTSIEHFFLTTPWEKKPDTLKRIIGFLKPKKAIIFVKKGERLERYTKEMKYFGLSVGALSSALEKEERKKLITDFRKGKIQLLFSTELAARGLDINDISHIFNLDLPENAKSYQHRAGRTGRQNRDGVVISFVAKDELDALLKIANQLGIKLEKFRTS